MANGDPEYFIQSQIHGNVLNNNGTVETGWTITARDAVTGTTFPVFLPDDRYSADNARALILNKLEHIRSVHSLTD